MIRRVLRPFFCAILLALPVAVGVCAEPSSGADRNHTHTIYLVRHGAYEMGAKADPEIGPGLTPLGMAQARLVAGRLRGLPFRFDSMTSSTMARARETASIIHETLAEVPFDSSALISECTPPAFRTLDGEKAENLTKCADRIDAAFGALFTPTPEADRNDLLVCHGNVIRYFVTKALRVDTRAWLGMTVAQASVTVIRVRADGSMSVLAVGDVGHIPPNLQSWGTKDDPNLVMPKS